MRWNEYHQNVGMKPNSGLEKICAEYVGVRDAALDLGCGNMRDSLHMQKSGFKRVVAVDMEVPPAMLESIEFHQSRIEDYEPARGAYNLVACCNTLFYVKKQDVPVILMRIHGGLANEGIFFGNFA